MGKDPPRCEAEHHPTPSKPLIAFERAPLPTPKDETTNAKHEQTPTDLIRQQTDVPKPALETQHSRITLKSRRFDHGTVGAAQGRDPVMS